MPFFDLGEDVVLVLLSYLGGRDLATLGLCSREQHRRIYTTPYLWERCRWLECWAETDTVGADFCVSGGNDGDAVATTTALITRWRRAVAACTLSPSPRWRQLDWQSGIRSSPAPAQEGHSSAVLGGRWIVTMDGFTDAGISNTLSVLDGACLGTRCTPARSNGRLQGPRAQMKRATSMPHFSGAMRAPPRVYGQSMCVVGGSTVAVFGGCMGGGYRGDISGLYFVQMAQRKELRGAKEAGVAKTGGAAAAGAERGGHGSDEEIDEDSDRSEGEGGGDGPAARRRTGAQAGGVRMREWTASWGAPRYAPRGPHVAYNEDDTAPPLSRAYCSINMVSLCPANEFQDSGSSSSSSSSSNSQACTAGEIIPHLLFFGGIHDGESAAVLELARLPTPHATAEQLFSSPSKSGHGDSGAVVDESSFDARAESGAWAACDPEQPASALAWSRPAAVGTPPCARFGHSAIALGARGDAPQEATALLISGGSNGSDLLRDGEDLTDIFVLHLGGVERSAAQLRWSQPALSSPTPERVLGRCHTAALVGPHVVFFGGGAGLSNTVAALDVTALMCPARAARCAASQPATSASGAGGGAGSSSGGGAAASLTSHGTDDDDDMEDAAESGAPLLHWRVMDGVHGRKPSHRLSHSMAKVGEQLFVYGGWGGGSLPDMFSLDLGAGADVPGWPARTGESSDEEEEEDDDEGGSDVGSFLRRMRGGGGMGGMGGVSIYDLLQFMAQGAANGGAVSESDSQEEGGDAEHATGGGESAGAPSGHPEDE